MKYWDYRYCILYFTTPEESILEYCTEVNDLTAETLINRCINEGGKLINDENNMPMFRADSEAEKLEAEKNRLRSLREVECFPVINRGELWYSMLTESQLTELKTWYIAWLNVTETLEVPEKPTWIN